MGHTKDIPNERRQGPTLAKARGGAGGAERPWEGLTILGAEQSSAGSFPSAIFSLCFEHLTQTGERVYFLTWRVFRTPKGLSQEGNTRTPAKSFSVVKTNKQIKKTNSKQLITDVLEAMYGGTGEVVICLSVADSSFLQPTAAGTLQKDIFPFSWRVAKTLRQSKWQNIWLHLSVCWLFLPLCHANAFQTSLTFHPHLA